MYVCHVYNVCMPYACSASLFLILRDLLTPKPCPRNLRDQLTAQAAIKGTWMRIRTLIGGSTLKHQQKLRPCDVPTNPIGFLLCRSEQNLSLFLLEGCSDAVTPLRAADSTGGATAPLNGRRCRAERLDEQTDGRSKRRQ